MDRALGMLWSVGLDYFGFPSVLKDQSLTTRRAFAMVFLSPWSLEQRKCYWQPLEEIAKKVLLATFRRDVGWYEPQPEEILPR